MLAVRIRNFGAALQQLAPGASLDRPDVRLILCRTASRLAYLAYVTRSLLHIDCPVPGIDLAHASQAFCQYPNLGGDQPQPEVYVEADGEVLGALPAEITMVPDALTLLSPI
jgi:diacylglycerol kinase family enzyme